MSTAVDAMQQSLVKAMQAAQQADDRELAGKVRDEGRRLVFILYGLLRTCRLHSTENAAFEAPSIEFSNVLRGLAQILGGVTVICVEDQIYVNDIRLRANPREQVAVEAFVGELARHGVGGMMFHTPLEPHQAKALAMLLTKPPFDATAPRTALEAKVREVADIDLMPIHRFRIGGEAVKEQHKDYKAAVMRGAGAVRDAVSNLASDRIPNPLPVRRVVIDLVTSLKEKPDQATAAPLRLKTGSIGEQHLLSVTSLSLALGRALGLEDAALSDLGVAAMMHDVGYTKVPDKVGHPAAGARMLIKQRGFHEAKIRRILLVLEHHLHFQAPEGVEAQLQKQVRHDPPSLFARIVHICDDYDILTAVRPGYPAPLSPTAAMAAMWTARGTYYDPDLLALFARTLGRFPPGTLFELNDGRWGIVTSGGRDKERFNFPLVRIVRDAEGNLTDASEEVDLFLTRGRIQPKRLLEPSGDGVDIDSAVGAAFGQIS